nr:hypothetical protein [uncultured Agathobacter sp.]
MKSINFFIKNQINRSEFKICFTLLNFLSVFGMIIGYMQNYKNDFMFLRSAADNFFLTSTDARVARMLFVFLFPLMAASFGTCYSGKNNKESNGFYALFRMNKKLFVYGNAVVVVCTAIVGFVIVLGLNQFMCILTYPLEGYDNRWGMAPYRLIESFQPDLLFDIWTIQNPYVYNILYILMISIMAGGIALLSYSLGFMKEIKKWNSIQLSAFVFAIFILLFVAGEFFQFPTISYLSYVEPGHSVNLMQYMIFIGSLYILGSILTIRGERTYENL